MRITKGYTGLQKCLSIWNVSDETAFYRLREAAVCGYFPESVSAAIAKTVG